MGIPRVCNNGKNTVCVKITAQRKDGAVKRICGNHSNMQGPNKCMVRLKSNNKIRPVQVI